MISATALLDAARVARRDGNILRAETLYRACLAQQLPVHAELAGIFYEAGRFGDAERVLDGAATLFATQPELQFLRGLSRSAGGRLQQALTDLDAVVARTPAMLPALFNRALVLHRLERTDEALDDFLSLTRLSPQLVDGWANAGVLQLRRGEHGAAVQLLRQALRLSPDHPQLTRSLGNALRAGGDIEAALGLHAAVEALTPDDPAALTDHALSLLQAGRPAPAYQRYVQASTLAPADQTALAGMYMAGLAIGDSHRVAQLMDFPNLLGVDEAMAVADPDLGALRTAVLALPDLVWEPAGRSTRGGQQSAMLDLDPGSAFGDVGRMVSDAVARRMSLLAAQPHLAAHPWMAGRPARWRLQAWATVLHDGGNQSPHIHPAGWMSGVFYLDAGTAAGNAGALVFGHLPAEVGLEVACNVREIQPRTGQLVTFPSYFFHHTRPYQGQRPRISLAFDVMPVVVTG